MTYFDAPYRPADLSLNSDAINNDLVGFWPLTDGSGTSAVDVSTGGNNGTQSGGVSWASSEIGTVASFDGSDDQFDISHNSSYNAGTTGELTVTAWAKFDTFGTYRNVVSKDYGYNIGAREWVIYGEPSGNRVSAQLFDSSGTAYGVGTGVNTTYTGVWYFLSMVWDGTDLKLFVDGSVASTASAAITPRTSTEDVQIGYNGRFRHDGDVQNVRIFNAALTAAQVEQLYTRPWTGTNYDTEALWLSPPASPTLSTASESTSIMTSCLGWWPLTEGSGSTVTDLVGSNDGTLTSGVGWKEAALGTSSEHTHGNDYISTGLDLAGESAVTASAWVRNDGVAAGQYGKIVCQSHGANFDMHMSVAGNHALKYYINNTSVTANSSDVPAIGTWFHVCAVWQQSSRQEIYVNGELSASVTADTSVIGSNPHNVFIGGTTARSSRGWDGGIQNVRIWNRALSSDEVSTLYERPWIGAEYNESFYLYPPVPSSLTPLDSSSINTDQELWLPLTDQTGTTAVDISGGGNNGTLDAALTHVNTAKGAAVSFPANGGIDSSATISSQPYSVSLWGYMNSATTYYYQMFIGQTSGSRPTIYIDNSSLLKMYGGSNTLSSTTTIGVGEWFHVVGVFDGSSSALYVNGVVEASGAVGPYDLSGGMRIGHWWTGGRDFDGNIQNVRVWSRALSATEVADIYYSPWLGSAYTGTSSDPATNRFFSPATFARLG